MKHLLPDTSQMIDVIEACADADALNGTVARIASTWGVTSHLGGIVPAGPVAPSDQPGYVILGRWPDEWARRYFHQQYVEEDPTIAHVRTASAPLLWRDIEADGRSRRIMDEATEFGLLDGMTIPQYTLDGVKIGISFSGERIDPSPEARTSLLILSSLASSRALSLTSSVSPPPVSLTPRERECLLWITEGKTDWEIGVILGISHKSVERHVQRMRQRLGAATRAHAAVIALRLGILR